MPRGKPLQNPHGTFAEPSRNLCGTFPAREILKKTIAGPYGTFEEPRGTFGEPWGTLWNLASKGNLEETLRNLTENVKKTLSDRSTGYLFHYCKENLKEPPETGIGPIHTSLYSSGEVTGPLGRALRGRASAPALALKRQSSTLKRRFFLKFS